MATDKSMVKVLIREGGWSSVGPHMWHVGLYSDEFQNWRSEARLALQRVLDEFVAQAQTSGPSGDGPLEVKAGTIGFISLEKSLKALSAPFASERVVVEML